MKYIFITEYGCFKFICLLLMILLRQVKNVIDSCFIFFLKSKYFSKTHHRIQINSIVEFTVVMKKMFYTFLLHFL